MTAFNNSLNGVFDEFLSLNNFFWYRIRIWLEIKKEVLYINIRIRRIDVICTSIYFCNELLKEGMLIDEWWVFNCVAFLLSLFGDGEIFGALLLMLLCDENKILENKSDEILLEKISYSFLKNFLKV